MTVAELIAKLKKMPQDAEVVIFDDNEYGHTDTWHPAYRLREDVQEGGQATPTPWQYPVVVIE